MTGWTDYVSITVAVIGVAQAVFLCLILRSEGARAFGANRWMILFIATIAINLIEDVLEQFVSADLGQIFDLFFDPINYVIAPAIYLYFCEISGRPSRQPWVHFILPLLVLNLIGWAITHDSNNTVVWSDGYRASDVIGGFCWTAIFIQISLYIALLWGVSCRYFRQTQEQLGADRNIMRRWLGVILGGLMFVFVTVVVDRIVSLYLPHDTEMFGTEIAFVAVLFAMSYEIAAKPALFVMADWPTDFDDAAARPVSKRSEAPGMTRDHENDPPRPEPEPTVRPLLDEDEANRALAQLKDIQKCGDILLDPMVSRSKLARAVGLTPNQLSYVLNHHVGQSFFDFVNRARIAEARAVLLLEPDRTILDIALSVGFNSKSTFNLAFKKMTGETPSAVREAARKAV
ncbi:AraC family transcriptional regulator [Thalassospira sp.]|uniref:helix-turn-helix domain-containing protein n=1 Tax=Thalassospira sp. TaxID=1912094 RepID=UPI0027350515|nr:helix-turn-helix domain-containing protein [Thalassospira sp.]MDP2699763.1 helix-turn-helix domain-containing protein [Thalassospira sp.]